MSVDLRTRYLGLELRSPLLASASPITRDPAVTADLEAAGAGAIVMPSLFEEEVLNEEIELDASLQQGTERFAESLDYFPDISTIIGEGERYLRALERIRARASIPIIASLNANSLGGWVRYAQRMADAGADALELNLYRVTVDRTRTAADVEYEDLALIAAVRAAVALPLAVKLSPYYTALPEFVHRVLGAGADGLVLFNRFYQPDLDLDELAVVHRLTLSHPSELLLPMRWIAILRPQVGPDVSIAATSGVHDGSGALKALMVGADVVQMASGLLKGGARRIQEVEAEMRAWLTEHEYGSVRHLRGSASQGSVADPSSFERAQYIRTLHSWSAPSELEPQLRAMR